MSVKQTQANVSAHFSRCVYLRVDIFAATPFQFNQPGLRIPPGSHDTLWMKTMSGYYPFRGFPMRQPLAMIGVKVGHLSCPCYVICPATNNNTARLDCCRAQLSTMLMWPAGLNLGSLSHFSWFLRVYAKQRIINNYIFDSFTFTSFQPLLPPLCAILNLS